MLQIPQQQRWKALETAWMGSMFPEAPLVRGFGGHFQLSVLSSVWVSLRSEWIMGFLLVLSGRFLRRT